MKKLRKFKRVRVFTVDEKTWLRGEKYADGSFAPRSGLLIGTDMCCLGHLGRACGLSNRQLRAQPYFYNAPQPSHAAAKQCPVKTLSREAALRIALINDNHIITDKVRKRFLRTAFKKLGLTIHFKK